MAKRAAQILSLLFVKSVTVAGQTGTESARLLLSARSSTINVKDFGADGKDKDYTNNIQDAFDELTKRGKGHLVFPKGTYKCGPINFSDLTDSKIEFQKGAELHMLGRKDFQKYSDEKAWFKGVNCNGLEISGGTFYGGSKNFPKLSKNDDRPRMFSFYHMDNFEFHGADLLDSVAGHFHLTGGNSVNIHDLTLNTEVQDNSDGITLEDVTHGTVAHATITNHDDCLKITGKSSDVTYEHCSCTGGHGLTVGGGGTTLEVQRITFSDIDLHGMSLGARLKVPGDCEGFAKDIHWEKLNMTNVRSPMFVETTYASDKHKGSNKFEVGDLYYSHITAKYDSGEYTGSGKDHACDPDGNETPGTFNCDDSAPCKKLHLSDISVESDAKWFCEKAKGEMKNVFPSESLHNCLSPSDSEVV